MFAKPPVLTDTGKTLLLRATSGERIVFTRFMAGDGILQENETEQSVTALKHPVLSNIPAGLVPGTAQDGYVQIQGSFNNQNDVPYDFLWTELGLFAEDEQGVEYLYAYGYEEEYAELLKAGGSNVASDQKFTVGIAVGDSGNITAYFLPESSWATQADLEDHINDKNNPHEVSPGQIGAAATDHKHSASDITSGVLSVARGGTGVQSYAELSKKLNIDTGYVIGFYTGDGQRRKDIELGFNPTKVVVFTLSQGGDHDQTSPYYAEPGKNVIHSACGNEYITYPENRAAELFNRGHGGLMVKTGGFIVGYGGTALAYPQVNTSGKVYMYIAWK